MRIIYELNKIALIGTILIAVYIIQDVFQLKPQFLVDLQSGNTYKQVSGFFLVFNILLQWTLSVNRANEAYNNYTINLINHKTVGAITPLFLYFHAMTAGSLLNLILVVLVLTSVVTGLWINWVNSIIKKISSLSIKAKGLAKKSWLFLHIFSSSFTIITVFLHVYMVYVY